MQECYSILQTAISIILHGDLDIPSSSENFAQNNDLLQ